MRKWRGPMVVEGVQTGDGRMFVENALSWIETPFPLQPDHWADDNIGTVERVWRDGLTIWGEGTFDDESESGAEFARKMDSGVAPMGARWPLSVDVDNITAQLVDTQPEAAEDTEDDDVIVIVAASGPWAHVHNALRAAALSAAAGDGDPLAPDAVVVDEFSMDRFVERVTQGRIRGVSLCNIQAITSDDENLAWMELVDEPAVTAAAPLAPPRSWFAEPPQANDLRLRAQRDGSRVVPMTITDDGRVYGHVAPPNQCHIGIANECVTAPTGVDLDGYFNLGLTVCADGTEVCTAPLLMGCDHARQMGLDVAGARDHYANTGVQWADVRAVWDQNAGTVWLAGGLRPNVSDEQVRVLRGGGWSGDWRMDAGRWQLVAVQAVGTPGFGIRRAVAASAEVLYGESGDIEAVFVTSSAAPDGPNVIHVPAEQMEQVRGRIQHVATCGCKSGFEASVLAKLDVLDRRTRHLRSAEADALAASLGQEG